MSSRYVMPTADSISELLEMIFGEGVTVTDQENVESQGESTSTFIDGSDEVVALCTCDRAFICFSGAALSMIPADVAKEMVTSGDLTEVISGNFYEVMNICSKLMMSDSSDHLRLAEVLPFDAAQSHVEAMSDSASRVTYNVAVPGYGDGLIDFLVA